MTIGSDKDVDGGATVWTTAEHPEAGRHLRKWTATPYEDVVRLEPAWRMGGTIFAKPAEVYATAEVGREQAIKRLEGAREQVQGLTAQRPQTPSAPAHAASTPTTPAGGPRAGLPARTG